LQAEEFEKVFKMLLQFTDLGNPMAYQALGYWFIVSPLNSRPMFFNYIAKTLYPQIRDKNSLLAEAQVDLVRLDYYYVFT
jgi:hypothetical protein